VRAVIASHPDVDHFGGASYWQQKFAAQVVAHRFDAALMESHEVFLEQRANEFSKEFQVAESDEGLQWLRENGAEISINQAIDFETEYQIGEDLIHIIHLPGHSRGHLGVYEPKSKMVLISDAVLGAYVPYSDGSPSFPPTYRFVQSYLETIQRLMGLDFECLATAHYGTFSREDGMKFLQDSLDFAAELEDSVLRAIRRTKRTLPEILNFVDAEVGLWPKPASFAALAFPVFGHLEFLEKKGLARRTKGEPIAWLEV
jgi:glyoxylase-like metal-dependent hydrolase (beta-lactamase superfamily II)